MNDLDELKEETLNAVSKDNENMLNGTMSEFIERLEFLKKKTERTLSFGKKPTENYTFELSSF